MRLVFASLFLVLATAAHAEVYECDDGSGHKSFSQQPCGSNAQVVPLQGDTGGSITLNTDTSADSLLAACKLMMRGVTVASNLARENININTAQQRVFGFIRDHISNQRAREFIVDRHGDQPRAHDAQHRRDIVRRIGREHGNALASRVLSGERISHSVSERIEFSEAVLTLVEPIVQANDRKCVSASIATLAACNQRAEIRRESHGMNSSKVSKRGKATSARCLSMNAGKPAASALSPARRQAGVRTVIAA